MPSTPRVHSPSPVTAALRHSAPLGLALLASIPAFYDSLMPMPGAWAPVLYGLSGTLVLAWLAWQGRAHARGPAGHPGPPPRTWAGRAASAWADGGLGLGLLLAACLPASSSSPLALGARLLLALLTLLRLLVLCKPLFARASLGRLLAMAGGVLGLCGVGFYLIDPEVESLSSGLWLAFSTAATVGYGDVVPSTTASRIFSVFVVLLGYGVLSLVTASIAAMFVDSQERKVERTILRDLHQQLHAVRQEIAALREAVAHSHEAPAPPVATALSTSPTPPTGAVTTASPGAPAPTPSPPG